MLRVTLCFLGPLTAAIELDLAGGLFLAELVLPCFAIAVILTRKRPLRSSKALFLLAQLGIVYMAALTISDMWNESNFDQYSRGWARLAVFLINLISIHVLIDNSRRRLIAFTLGLIAGRVMLTIMSLDDNLLNWKLGFSKPTALATVLFCVALYRYRWSVGRLCPAVLVGLGVYNLLMDFRSLAAVLIATAISLIASDLRNSKRRVQRWPQAWTAAFTGVCGLAAAGLTYQLYVYAATSGWLDERATGKFQAQTENTDLPLLVAGRNELLVTFEAILDAPILGHGSWPENRYYAEKIAVMRYQHNLSGAIAVPETDLIPTHSHLFGGWVEAGLAGGVFWSAVLYMAGAALVRSFQGRSAMRPLYIYGSILLVWDVLFSPFSGFRRLETAYLLIVVVRGLLQRHCRARSRRVRVSRSSRRRRRSVATNRNAHMA